jgi:hypothetical protein
MGRNSRKSSTHNEGSIKHETITQNFEDFEEEIDAIMSGGSIGSKNNSKGSKSKKGLHKRSNTVHVSHSSGTHSDHPSSQFYLKSKKSLKAKNKSLKARGKILKNSNSIGFNNNYYNKYNKGHYRHNTNHLYEVEDIKEVSEDGRSNTGEVESLMSKVSKTGGNYHRTMDEFYKKRRDLRIPDFGSIKSMASLNYL